MSQWKCKHGIDHSVHEHGEPCPQCKQETTNLFKSIMITKPIEGHAQPTPQTPYPHFCWVIELHEMRNGSSYNRYWWQPLAANNPEDCWTEYWNNAIKFYDRASAEQIAAHMPIDWPVHILEHQIG